MKKVNEDNTSTERGVIYDVKMNEWGLEKDSNHRIDYLVNLLGFKDLADMLANYHEEAEHTVKLLAGPHGATVHQIMLARRKP